MEGGFDMDLTPEQQEYDDYLGYKSSTSDSRGITDEVFAEWCGYSVERLRQIVNKFDSDPNKRVDYTNKTPPTVI